MMLEKARRAESVGAVRVGNAACGVWRHLSGQAQAAGAGGRRRTAARRVAEAACREEEGGARAAPNRLAALSPRRPQRRHIAVSGKRSTARA